jgi:hypothetical protein
MSMNNEKGKRGAPRGHVGQHFSNTGSFYGSTKKPSSGASIAIRQIGQHLRHTCQISD